MKHTITETALRRIIREAVGQAMTEASKRGKPNGSHVGSFEEFLTAMRSANRDIEHERNGGRWIAKDRPHKNKKKYDRKRDRSIEL